jgi:hypothetical protein
MELWEKELPKEADVVLINTFPHLFWNTEVGDLICKTPSLVSVLTSARLIHSIFSQHI